MPELPEPLRWGKNNQLQLLKMFEKNKCGKNIVAKFALLTGCMYESNRKFLNKVYLKGL